MTETRPDLSIVIPAYNEGDRIEGVLRAVDRATVTVAREILVVCDFPQDTTIPAVQRLAPEIGGLRLHLNERGRGVLNALRAGLSSARAEFIVVTMGDGSDEYAAIGAMLDRARRGADMVAASRYMPGGHQYGGPILKRALSRAAGLILHFVAGLPIHDPTNNFKLYSRSLLEAVTIESRGGFELALELSVKCHRLGMNMQEVPTTWRERASGESRFALRAWLPHYLRWFWYGLKTRWSRLPAGGGPG